MNNKELIQRTIPRAPPAISRGTARRISFLTPDNDVYVDAPVKFMARNAVRAHMITAQAIVSSQLIPWKPNPAPIKGSKMPPIIPRDNPFKAKALPGR